MFALPHEPFLSFFGFPLLPERVTTFVDIRTVEHFCYLFFLPEHLLLIEHFNLLGLPLNTLTLGLRNVFDARSDVNAIRHL
jgi:hypothetical protein